MKEKSKGKGRGPCSCRATHTSECEARVRRASKSGRNHYRTHGPCMTDSSRAYWRWVYDQTHR